MIKESILKVYKHENLTYDEAYKTMDEIMSGEASEVQMSAYLTAMSMKGGIFDDSALRKILSLFNLTAHFGLNQEGDTMICSCSNALSTAEYNLLTRQISQLMPSWLDFELSIS